MSIILLIGLFFLVICHSNGLTDKNTYLDTEPIDLESLPLNKLLEMKKELRKKEHTIIGPDADAGTSSAALRPNAMALRRRADALETKSTATGSSMQTAFQISLTVLSFLAFGGYVISLVAQNMRRPLQSFGTTAPRPLKTVVVDQNRRPGLLQRPVTGTAVSFGRRERSLRSPATAPARRRN